MLSMSSDAIAAIRQNAPTHIRIQFAGNATIFDGNDVAYDGGVEIEQILNSDTDLTVGKAVSTQLKLSMLNTSRLIGLDWSQPVTVRLGVEVNGGVEYCSLGVFNGSKPERMELVDVVEFVAFDNMCKFDVEASSFLSGLNWSKGITVYSLLSRICSYVGVPIATLNNSYILSNIMSRTYTSNPIGGSGYTCRDVVAWIAEANCCYARINPAGALELVWFNTDTYNTETISRNDWFSLNASEESCSISALKVYMSENDIGVVIPSTASVTTKNLYRIFDNPFLSTSNSSEVTAYITPIYNRLTGFAAYKPISVSADGHWYLEAGDVIKVETTENTYVMMPIFVKNLRWNGATFESYQTTGGGERETISKATGYSLNLNGRIHEIRQTVDENYERIQDEFGNYYTKTETASQIRVLVADSLGNYYTKTETASLISSTLSDSLGNYYTKTETATQISTSISSSLGNYYTKTETSNLVSTSISTSLGNYSTTTQTSNMISTEVKKVPTTFRQTSQPTSTTGRSLATGDLWIDSDDNNKLYRYDGSSWVATPYSDSNKVSVTSSLQTADQIVNSAKTYTDGQLTSYSTTTQTSSAISSAVGNCYGKASGITIESAGITMDGSQYIKMNSGYIKAGSWYFSSSYGLCYGSLENTTVQMQYSLGNNDPSFMISTHGKLILEPGNETIGDVVFEQPANTTYIYVTAPNGLLSLGKTSRHIDQIDVDYLRVYQSFTNSSSREVKDDITPLGEQGDVLDLLTPVSFVYNYDKAKRRKFGLIYEDTVDILPEICTPKDDKVPKGIDYINVVPLLLREIQSLRRRVAELEKA